MAFQLCREVSFRRQSRQGFDRPRAFACRTSSSVPYSTDRNMLSTTLTSVFLQLLPRNFKALYSRGETPNDARKFSSNTLVREKPEATAISLMLKDGASSSACAVESRIFNNSSRKPMP